MRWHLMRLSRLGKQTMLHDCCDSEKHQRVGRYHGSGIVVRALFVVLRDMVGNAEVNRELRDEIESIILNDMKEGITYACGRNSKAN